jgi:hypothetical protein
VGLAVCGDTLFVHGGYSKVGDADDDELEHGAAHDDTWALDLGTYTVRGLKGGGGGPGRPSGGAEEGGRWTWGSAP